MRISDWSSDVCSSDLHPQDLVDDAIALFVAALDDVAVGLGGHGSEPGLGIGAWGFGQARASGDFAVIGFRTVGHADRKSVVEGKGVSVRVGLGGRRTLKTKQSKPCSSTT